MSSDSSCQTKIKEWHQEEWDGTLHGYANWCMRGRELHHELYLTHTTKIEEEE